MKGLKKLILAHMMMVKTPQSAETIFKQRNLSAVTSLKHLVGMLEASEEFACDDLGNWVYIELTFILVDADNLGPSLAKYAKLKSKNIEVVGFATKQFNYKVGSCKMIQPLTEILPRQSLLYMCAHATSLCERHGNTRMCIKLVSRNKSMPTIKQILSKYKNVLIQITDN